MTNEVESDEICAHICTSIQEETGEVRSKMKISLGAE